MANRLGQQTSPYLRQHADNPVDWYPWGDEALERARREDKPILLSIGYSACHWCHVMAHESFEDSDVAAVMNRLFVNVKVDREERPDLDQIYQLAHHMLSQRAGGWPLTVFLTPEQVPFYAGTYFPKQSRFGLPGFVQLCEGVAQAYRSEKTGIERQNGALMQALSRHLAARPETGASLDAAPIDAALESLASSFDSRHGGFGGAPKFPHAPELELCLRRYAARGDDKTLRLALFTLEKMALGGIYDQLGGGFARYSVDAEWGIPHFEKMLYDNGPLLRLYSDAWCASGNALFSRVVEQTAGWMMREMQSPGETGGGYYSSLDADSEHEEGKFYVWSAEELRRTLDAAELDVAAAHWGLDGPPNFENRYWHLHVARPLDEVAAHLALDPGACARLLESARAKLFAQRERRVRPGRDEKILTSWNALAILGMARAGRAFGRDDWMASARRAFAFVQRTLWREGRLLATYKDGRAHLNAYLDDHAYLLAACLELLQAGFDPAALEFARRLGDCLIERFEDQDHGGFYFTSHDHEPLIARPKPASDNATPSGNGVAALALLRLSFVSGEKRYADAAERALAWAASALAELPAAHASLLMALEELLEPTTTVVLRGRAQAVAEWAAGLARRHLPHALVLPVPGDPAGLSAPLAKPAGDPVNAWVCEGVTCLAPVQEFEQLARLVCKGRQSG